MAAVTGNPRGKEEHTGKDHPGKDPMDKAKDVGAQVMDKAKDMGTQAMDKAKDVGAQAMGKAKDVSANVTDKAKDALSAVGEMASQAASTVGKRADDMAASAGADMKQWGDSIASKGSQEGVLGQASHAVADTLREGGRYIEDAKFSGMADDLGAMIRRNPMPAVLIGIGVGFILGRVLRD